MIKLLILSVITTTLLAKGRDTESQIFYLNDKAISSIEFYSKSFESESHVNIPTDIYIDETEYIGLSAQYGLLGTMLNVGITQERTTKTESGDREGNRDTKIFVRGRYKFLLYGYDYNISHDDYKDSNSYSGGNSFSYTLGLTAFNFGLTRTMREDYKGKVGDGNTKFEYSDYYVYKLFYDIRLNVVTISPYYEIRDYESDSIPKEEYTGYGLRLNLHLGKDYDLYGQYEKFKRDQNTASEQKYESKTLTIGLRARF